MPHHIGKDEDIAAALLRLAGDELAAAQRQMTGGKARAESVHAIRQHLKRVRTLLRVIETGPGERAKAARRSLSTIAQMLAGARDADVAAASARELAATTPHAADLGFDRVVMALEREALRAHRERTPLTEVDQSLTRLASEIAALESEPFDGRAALETGFERAYRRGRRWMRRAHCLGTPELHHWRKCVKELWHLLRLAGRRINRKAKTVEPVLDRLDSLLGLDHDHAVLADRLALSPAGDPSLMAQLALIADRRRELEAEAFELGEAIYGESPKAFLHNLDLG